jgi:two-component sensor histidine kinase
MALIHEKLYQSEDLARVDFRDYLHSLSMTLYQSYLQTSQGVTVDIDVEKGLRLGIDQAIPCGLIVNELVSNALKHAFPSGQGRVSVTLSKSHNDDEYRLVIEDDGTGLPPDIELERSDFLGLKLVSLLVKQLHATVSVEPATTGERPGARYTIEFQDRPGTAAPD